MKKSFVTVTDQFCGALFWLQSKFFGCAYTLIKQFMMSRTKHPEHMAFIVIHCSPCPIALECRFVSYVQDARLSTPSTIFTGFADCWQIRIFSAQSICKCVRSMFGAAISVVPFHGFWIQLFEYSKSLSSSFYRAFIRTITTAWAGIRRAEEFLFTIWAFQFYSKPMPRSVYAPRIGSMISTFQRTISLSLSFGLKRLSTISTHFTEHMFSIYPSILRVNRYTLRNIDVS